MNWQIVEVIVLAACAAALVGRLLYFWEHSRYGHARRYRRRRPTRSYRIERVIPGDNTTPWQLVLFENGVAIADGMYLQNRVFAEWSDADDAGSDFAGYLL